MTLTREQILSNIKTSKVVKVSTPEWGGDGKGHVYVRVISGNETDVASKIIEGDSKDTSESQAIGKLLILFLCDQHGKSILKPTDIKEVLKSPLTVLNRIVQAGLNLNGLTESGLNDLAKEFDSDPLAESGSALPERPDKASRKRRKLRAPAS